jgi:hypothetical protein
LESVWSIAQCKETGAAELEGPGGADLQLCNMSDATKMIDTAPRIRALRTPVSLLTTDDRRQSF